MKCLGPGTAGPFFCLAFSILSLFSCSEPSQIADTSTDSDTAGDSETESETHSIDTSMVVAVDPPSGDTDVPRDQIIRVKFSRHLDPATVRPEVFNLYSGQLFRWLMVVYAPVTKEIVLWTSSPLRAEAVWELELLEGLRERDGTEIAGGLLTSFITSSEEVFQRPFEKRRFDDAAAIFNAHCISCHAPPAPLAGIDLSSAEGVDATVIGNASAQWPTMNLLTRYYPGNSYLLYKIIKDADFIAGRGMPRTLDENTATDSLTSEEQQTISDWIAGGAVF